MNTDPLILWSMALLAAGLLLAGCLLIAAEVRRARSGRVLGRALRRTADAVAAIDSTPDAAGAEARDLPVHWLQTRAGRLLVADEDRRLIDQCGLPSAQAQLVFLVLRVVLGLLLPLLAWLLLAPANGRIGVTYAAGAAAIGFMGPKWVLRRMAAARRERMAQELPLFVDLLRLLQGVGLSLDQSLQVMADDFSHVMRVLGGELTIANRQYAQGRTREHSLQRLATLHDNEHLASLVALLVQVDRHGGAVQEPLQQYSDRLREHRRSELKGRIGKITVKMTGVMVTTLLPALVIVTAGPGFIAVLRSLGAMSK